jgi:hypothetical protein
MALAKIPQLEELARDIELLGCLNYVLQLLAPLTVRLVLCLLHQHLLNHVLVLIKARDLGLKVVDCPVKVACTVFEHLEALVCASQVVEDHNYQVSVHIFALCCDLLQDLLPSL